MLHSFLGLTLVFYEEEVRVNLRDLTWGKGKGSEPLLLLTTFARSRAQGSLEQCG